MIYEFTDKLVTQDSVVYTYLVTIPSTSGGPGFTDTYKMIFDSSRLTSTILSNIYQGAIIHGFQTFTGFDGIQVNSIQYTESIPDNFEPQTCDKDYAEGLGETYRDCSTVGGPDILRLFYFKKGNIEWGTPTAINSILESSFRIYPNPFHNVIHFEFTDAITYKDAFLELTDIGGRTIYRTEVEGNSKVSIPMDLAPRGGYLLQLSMGNNSAMKL